MWRLRCEINKEKNKLSIWETKLKEQKINNFYNILDKKYAKLIIFMMNLLKKRILKKY